MCFHNCEVYCKYNDNIIRQTLHVNSGKEIVVLRLSVCFLIACHSVCVVSVIEI